MVEQPLDDGQMIDEQNCSGETIQSGKRNRLLTGPYVCPFPKGHADGFIAEDVVASIAALQRFWCL